MIDSPKKGIALIVDRIPPPGKMGKGGDDAADDGGDSGGDDYNAAKDSMAAFMEALKGDDVDKALDAWADVKANC